MWQLKTFGGLALLGDGTDGVPRVVQRRRLALLAVLDAAGPAGTTRERILALLWPDATAEVARHSLAQLVYALRRQLGDDSIVSEGDTLRVDTEHLSSDRSAFEALLERGELDRGAACYTGPYLDGFGVPGTAELERWIERERERLAARYAYTLETLAADAARSGDHVRAAARWRARAALDPLSGPVALHYMRALSAAGDVAAALQHARVHELLRREELELSPDADVAAYAAQLRDGAARAEPPGPTGVPTATPAPAREPRALAAQKRTPAVAGAARPAHGGGHRAWRRPAVAASVAVVLLAVLALLAVNRIPPRDAEGAGSDPPRLVVLGAFRTSDSTLGLAVHEAVRAELENTPGIRLLDDAQLATALHRMERPANAPLTDAETAELAQREGAAVAVVGTVTPVGAGALVVVRLIDGATGRALKTFTEHPATADAVLAAITRVSRDAADRVRGVRAHERPDALPAVTTRSLAALRDYAVARHALGHFDRVTAMQAVTAALAEDSLFALARYLRADLLWFGDHERQAEQELRRALAQSDRLPLRERLVVRARYEQLVADRTDSALAYWSLLRDLDPSQPLAYEGMAWSYRAQGRWLEAAAVADTAMALDSSTVTPSATNRVYALLSDGDTTEAMATAVAVHARCPWLVTQTRFVTALVRRDWPGALAAASDAGEEIPNAEPPYRQVALLGEGRLSDARVALARVESRMPHAQYVPRAVLAQGWVERVHGGRARAAADAARAALVWVGHADLSAPAIARLTERAAELASRAGDTALVAEARRMVVGADAGRRLPSFRLALLTIQAADAFARGDMRSAAELADESRREMFFGRALAPILLMEADARAALGERDVALALYRLLLDVRASAGDDVETWALVREVAAERLGKQAPRWSRQVRPGAGRALAPTPLGRD